MSNQGEFNYPHYLLQAQSFGCGVYAVANALQSDNFVTEKRLEESKNGNNLGQLNKWLIEDFSNLFIEAMYYTCTGKNLPPDICGLKPYGEGVSSMPVLMDVQYSEDSKMHFVAGELTPNGDLLIIDSLKKHKAEWTTLAKYNRKYYRVFGLYHFRDIDTGNYLMRFGDNYERVGET